MGELARQLLGGGGVASLIVAALYAAKVLRRRPVRRRREMTDGPTAQAVLFNLLEVERANVARKDERIKHLEAEVERERKARYKQQREYEAEIAELRDQLAGVGRQLAAATEQLDALQARIHRGGTQ